MPPMLLRSSRARRPGATPPHEICDFAGAPGGAEAGVKGPGAASSRIWRCAPRRATLSLAPAADAANLRRNPESRHSRSLVRGRREGPEGGWGIDAEAVVEQHGGVRRRTVGVVQNDHDEVPSVAGGRP